MKPGIYRNLSNADYHGGAGISNSGLGLIHKTPAHYKSSDDARKDEFAKEKSTKAQFIGSEFHCLLLEPTLFVKDYTLAFRQSDMPEAIDSRDVLVAMAEKINAETDALITAQGVIRKADELVALITQMNTARLPKLSTSGSKADLLARIHDELGIEAAANADSAPELRAVIASANTTRPGHLSTSGSIDHLAQTLRENGIEITLLRDLVAEYRQTNNADLLINTSASMADLAAAIRANGTPVKLWAEVKAEWEANNGHRGILTPEQWDTIHRMRDSVMRHPSARALLTTAKNVVVDVKTTEDASPEGFAKSIANYRYHTQHPFYLDGLREAIRQGSVTDLPNGEAEVSAYWVDEKTGELCRCRPDFWSGRPDNFVFLAVEKKAPYAVGVYLLDAESVELGRAEYRADLTLYSDCKALDAWPAYSDKVQSISLPQWQFQQSALKLAETAA